MKKYKTIVSGGTFDHFHKGHKAFIQGQLAISEKAYIGITSDAYVASHKSEGIEAYNTRLENVKKFLEEQDVQERVELTKIDDFYVPSLWIDAIEAIAVTNDTKNGAMQINQRRASEGLVTYPIEIIPEIFTQDGKVLSSSRIRNGEIDRDGNVWVNPKYTNHIFYLPENLRSELQKPFGTLYKTIDKWIISHPSEHTTVITIGDVVSESLLKRHFNQKIAVIDLFVERKKMYPSLSDHAFTGEEEIFEVENPAGTIHPELFITAKKTLASEKRSIIYVHGEEDLAVLPFILTAPLSYIILYGQPHEGTVSVTVTEDVKNVTKKLLEKFQF